MTKALESSQLSLEVYHSLVNSYLSRWYERDASSRAIPDDIWQTGLLELNYFGRGGGNARFVDGHCLGQGDLLRAAADGGGGGGGGQSD